MWICSEMLSTHSKETLTNSIDLTDWMGARQAKCSHHFLTYQEFYCFKSIFWFMGVADKNISRFLPWEGGDFCPQSLDFLEEMNKKLYKLGTMGNWTPTYRVEVRCPNHYTMETSCWEKVYDTVPITFWSWKIVFIK